MKQLSAAHRFPFKQCLFLFLIFACAVSLQAQSQTIPISYGYNGVFLADGGGLEKPLPAEQQKISASTPWSMDCWVWLQEADADPTLIAGMGNPTDEYSRYFLLQDRKLAFQFGAESRLDSGASLSPKTWHLIAAVFDGAKLHLYSDGKEVASGELPFGQVSPVLEMAPATLIAPDGKHFGGKIASFTWQPQILGADRIAEMYKNPVDFSLINFELGSKTWPVQTTSSMGDTPFPQDPSTLPRSKAPFSQPVAQPVVPSKHSLVQTSDHQWTLAAGWKLTEVNKVSAGGAAISQAGFNTNSWMAATVPGTVLTTMIDRGIYPDPDFGLNNLAIPESLNKQDYWYRTEFLAPTLKAGERWTLVFHGINYGAVVWLNGQKIGDIKGAFIRGIFDVTGVVKPGKKNALAVQISPPPHPGLPHEQSIKAGPGPNGGLLCLDGPTFVATQGWDWIPAVRDRDTGIWQPVTLRATRQVKIGDAQVITTLPLPDISSAKVEIRVPLKNFSSETVQGEITASFGETTVVKHVTLSPGDNMVRLTPAEFAQLTVAHPRLWWPNGYGKPNLYTLKLTFRGTQGESDAKQLRFGIREITYELSLLDSTGHLRRVEISPTTAMLHNEQVVNVTHEGMRKIPDGWVASLLPGAENSPAVKPVADTRGAPYLVIKVNGVRIACKGGNWGMDDMLKRVSRKRLEPYFRLDRDANLNIIRNWVGQNTEEVFYDLADEYGMLVWNDFWESTQDDNLEAADPALFLANARDTILRFRNHPSIVMWCGRNEGVPQPIINKGLIHLVASLDGTRYYSPSSNQVNLQNSGPYDYQNPVDFYTKLDRGFSVEVGTPSMSTLESFRSTIAKPDQWPISDAWAYHDWHQSGNGDVAKFMDQLSEEFGAATSLPDFERKAQMLNYVDHRAIFEGFNAHLWKPNSGRLLWMTQPAWPSTMWQILSHDYDTQASYYAVKKACEPIHVQLNLASYEVAAINTTRNNLDNVSISAQVYSLQNKLLLEHTQEINAPADATTPGFKLALGPLLSSGMAFVRLELKNSAGQMLSNNFYWLGKDAAAYRQLNDLPNVSVAASATAKKINDEMQIQVQLRNPAASAALEVKLTLENAANGTRILPAYLSDNYISLLPGEVRSVEIEYPASAAESAPEIAMRGWNVTPSIIPVSHP